MYSRPLTRAEFVRVFDGGQRLYYKYVGKRPGQATSFDDYGLWRHYHLIREVDGRGRVEFVLPLDDILQFDNRLWRYAITHGYHSPA